MLLPVALTAHVVVLVEAIFTFQVATSVSFMKHGTLGGFSYEL